MAKFSLELPQKVLITHRITPETNRDKSQMDVWQFMEYMHRAPPEIYRYVSQPKARRNMMINHINSYEKYRHILQWIFRNLWRYCTAKSPNKIEDFHLEILTIFRCNSQWHVGQNLDKSFVRHHKYRQNRLSDIRYQEKQRWDSRLKIKHQGYSYGNPEHFRSIPTWGTR